MKKYFMKNKLLINGVVVALLIMLLITGMFAWIYGDVAPGVTGDMKIGDNSGLIFQIDEKEYSLVDINERLGLSMSSMVLSEVSSIDGVNFVKRDTAHFFQESGNPLGNNEIITFTEAKKNERVDYLNGSNVMESKFAGDYVEIKMNLLLDYVEKDADYYIYFLNGSMGTANGYETGFVEGSKGIESESGLNALRASITVEGAESYGTVFSGTDHRAIFGNAAEKADGTVGTPTKAIISTQEVDLQEIGLTNPVKAQVAGSYYIDYLYPSETPAQLHQFGTVSSGTDVFDFADYAINGADGLAGTEAPSDNYLFILNNNCKSVLLTLRIWLEGGSYYCKNGCIEYEDNVGFNMYLVAYKVGEDTAATPEPTNSAS